MTSAQRIVPPRLGVYLWAMNKTTSIPPHALELARRVIMTEADAVAALAGRLDSNFIQAVELILHCGGRVVVSGMGKSGHIGRKIAATLASTGTPAFFVHPAEASHGDLGMITPDDVLIALSNSGESPELTAILPLIKRNGTRLVAMTGKPESTLAREADVHLDVSVKEEACPLGLAPTSSTTATLAMGDALAIALLDTRGFSAEDFAFSHPGGSLGKRLLIHVSDIMHSGDRLPRVQPQQPLAEALLEMSRKGLGMTAVVDSDNTLLGLFTDGDLRRAFENIVDIHTTQVGAVMTTGPATITANKLAAEAVQILEQKKINGLLVVDSDNKLIGALNMHDLLRAGIV